MIDKTFDFIVDRLFPGDPVLKKMVEKKRYEKGEENNDAFEDTNSEKILQRN